MKFKEYYQSYILKHQNPRTRIMHYVGIWVTFLFLGLCLGFGAWELLPISWFVVYPFAWTGHLLFEKNMPAAFKNPIRAKMADFYMYWSETTGKFKNQLKEALFNESKK